MNRYTYQDSSADAVGIKLAHTHRMQSAERASQCLTTQLMSSYDDITMHVSTIADIDNIYKSFSVKSHHGYGYRLPSRINDSLRIMLCIHDGRDERILP